MSHSQVGDDFHYLFWVENKKRKPYNSCGNGSAMRVSPVGWYAKTLGECEKIAKLSAEVTHNHPDGIPIPSRQDIATTQKIKVILDQLGVNLIDHFIVVDNECVSILHNSSAFVSSKPLQAPKKKRK